MASRFIPLPSSYCGGKEEGVRTARGSPLGVWPSRSTDHELAGSCRLRDRPHFQDRMVPRGTSSRKQHPKLQLQGPSLPGGVLALPPSCGSAGTPTWPEVPSAKAHGPLGTAGRLVGTQEASSVISPGPQTPLPGQQDRQGPLVSGKRGGRHRGSAVLVSQACRGLVRRPDWTPHSSPEGLPRPPASWAG